MTDHGTDGRLHGRRVLITGASSGIGAATARAVTAAGGRVALPEIPGIGFEDKAELMALFRRELG